MRTRSLFLASALMLLGCDNPSSKPSPPPPPIPTPIATPSASAPSRARGPDVDVAALEKTHKCDPASKRPICMMLADFAQAGKWNLDNIRGADARYFGEAIFVEKGQTRTAFSFAIVKKVPTNEVPQGDLPIKAVFRELDPNLKPENAHAAKLLRALQQDNGVNKLNATAEYVRTYAPSTWDGATPTSGTSSLLFVDGGTYAREVRARRFLLVRLAPQGPDWVDGDGTYATLYPVSW